MCVYGVCVRACVCVCMVCVCVCVCVCNVDEREEKGKIYLNSSKKEEETGRDTKTKG